MDPFEESIAEIISNGKSRYFIEWIAQSRYSLSERIAKTIDNNAMLKLSGAMAFCDEVLASVDRAAKSSGISARLEINISGVMGNISVPKISAPRRKGGAGSSESQIKNLT